MASCHSETGKVPSCVCNMWLYLKAKKLSKTNEVIFKDTGANSDVFSLAKDGTV